jgi:hypothetical protein
LFSQASTAATILVSNQRKLQMKTALAHMVYFTLNDASDAKVSELVAACHKYLDGHPGVVYFSVGTLNKKLARPVNDRGYEVALNVVFDSIESHDAYQVAPRHKEFIDLCKSNWKQVRIFDSDLSNG